MMKNLFFIFLLSLSIGASAQKDLVPLDAELSTVTYPFPVKFRSFSSQNQTLRMAYMDIKPDNYKGKTIVLLHGKNFNGFYFENTANSLLNEGFRVVMPDQIGFGKSSKPQQYQFSFQQLSDNTKNSIRRIRD